MISAVGYGPSPLEEFEAVLTHAGSLPDFSLAFEMLRLVSEVAEAIDLAIEECQRASEPLVRDVRVAAHWFGTVALGILDGPALDLASGEIGLVLRRSSHPWLLPRRALLIGLTPDQAVDLLTVFPGRRVSGTAVRDLREGLHILRSRVGAAIRSVGASREVFALRLLCDLARSVREAPPEGDRIRDLDVRDRALFLAGDRTGRLGESEEGDLAYVRLLWGVAVPWLRGVLPRRTAPGDGPVEAGSRSESRRDPGSGAGLPDRLRILLEELRRHERAGSSCVWPEGYERREISRRVHRLRQKGYWVESPTWCRQRGLPEPPGSGYRLVSSRFGEASPARRR